MITINGNSIRIESREIFSAPEAINITHIFNDRILFLYEAGGLIPEGQEMRHKKKVTNQESLDAVNRNVLMIDFNGDVLWRIRSDAEYYNPWTIVETDIHQKRRWYAYTQDGYEYDLNIETGNVSNPLLMR